MFVFAWQEVWWWGSWDGSLLARYKQERPPWMNGLCVACEPTFCFSSESREKVRENKFICAVLHYSHMFLFLVCQIIKKNPESCMIRCTGCSHWGVHACCLAGAVRDASPLRRALLEPARSLWLSFSLKQRFATAEFLRCLRPSGELSQPVAWDVKRNGHLTAVQVISIAHMNIKTQK